MRQILRETLTKYLDFPQIMTVILNEQSGQALYDEFDLNEECGTIDVINQKLVKIISVRKFEEKFYCLILHEEHIYGWTVIENSYYVFPTRHSSVKINKDLFDISDINKMTTPNEKAILNNLDSIFSSNGYTTIDGTKYLLIFLRDSFIGLVKDDALFVSHTVKERIIIDSETKLFRDSTLKVSVEGVSQEKEVLTELIFPELSLLKINLNGMFYWVDSSNVKELSFDADEDSEECVRIIENIKHERKRTKEAIYGLITKVKTLEEELENRNLRIEFLEKKEIQYHNLKKSKLGRIQVAIWNTLRRR